MTDTASQVENEFGVPIPGVILPEEQWAKTAIKKLPPHGLLDFAEIFGRTAPIVIDLGCGNGRFTLSSALRRPEYDHLAIDILPVVMRYATRRANQRGLSNTRWAVIGGRELLEHYIRPGSIAEIHCYHPQPYYEKYEIKKRLLTPEFFSQMHRSLEPGGLCVLQTDNPAYWTYILRVAPAFFEFTEQTEPWPDAPKGRTRREILAASLKLPVFRGYGIARKDITEANYKAIMKKLPLPKFNADRGHMEIDRLEASGG